MALGAGIRAGKAFVEFIIGDKKIGGQLSGIASKLQKVGSIGAAVTGPIIAGFAACALTFADVGSELNDMAGRTKATVESLSELKFAAGQVGVPFGQVEKALRTLVQKGMDPADFDKMAAEIAAIPDPAERARAAMELFGTKTGAAILPLLEDLPALRQKARDLGLTMSGEAAESADALGDAWDIMKAQMSALGLQIGAAIAGPMTEFFTWSQNILAWVIDFIKENPRLVRAIAAITVGIAAATAAAVAFGTVLAIISAHPIIAALTLIVGLVLALVTYFGLASDAAGDFGKSLDAVKVPGTGDAQTQANLDRQAKQVQAELAATLKTGTAPTAPGAAAAASSKVIKVAGIDDVVRWTKDTADNVRRLVQLAGRGGFIAGGT